MFKKSYGFLVLCVLVFYVAYAARPFNTDDARIVEKNSCQLETWGEFHVVGESELWVLPSCNLFWNTEITFGGMLGVANHSLQFQIKKLFVSADEKNWGIGIALGNIHNYLIGADSKNDIYMYIPATLVFFDSRLALHANVGYNLQNFKGGVYTLGFGIEAMVTRQVYFIAEIYHSRFSPVMYQAGLRTWLLQDILQIDTTYGNSFQGNEHFVSIGFRFLSSQIFQRPHILAQ